MLRGHNLILREFLRQEFEVLAILIRGGGSRNKLPPLKGGGGARKVLPCLEEGRNKFVNRNFPIL